MEYAANLFTDGLNTDVHPLTTKNNILTDALNATFRTYNGNELLLLNDMGNTMILDSTTGNIMGLRDGFVPVGMKEYGGILYIASLNPITNESELGTIPSPLIMYTYPATPYKTNFNVDLTNIDDGEGTSMVSTLLPKYLMLRFLISDNRFMVGDQFIVNMDFTGINKIITRNDVTLTDIVVGGSTGSLTFPIVTGFANNEDGDDAASYGWFKLVLEAKVEKSDETITLNNITSKRLHFYIESDLDIQLSDYWFIVNSDNLVLDTERCLADELYRTYPNILPGYLYVHLEPELPENYQFFVNKSTNIKSPNIFIITESD